MIGLRGASRYTHESYAEAFALECQTLARVRGEMGLDNVRAMVPFCRRVEEGERVLAAMARHGLVRGEHGLEVYVMCEIPNNVILVDEFCRIFDGISIGSNDLTQLALGVDRDSELVAFDFDERDPGVLELLRLAVSGARRSPAFRELPTIAEAGVPGYEAGTWSGVIAPAGLPRPVLDRLNAAVNEAVRSSAFKERFGVIGDEPAGGTPEEFAATIRRDSARWGEVDRRSGAKID